MQNREFDATDRSKRRSKKHDSWDPDSNQVLEAVASSSTQTFTTSRHDLVLMLRLKVENLLRFLILLVRLDMSLTKADLKSKSSLVIRQTFRISLLINKERQMSAETGSSDDPSKQPMA